MQLMNITIDPAVRASRSHKTMGPARLLMLLSLSAAAQWQDPVSHNVSDALTHGQRAVAVDMDNDQDLDLINAYSLSDAVYLALNTNGDGSAWQLVEVGTDITAMFAVPFDGDCDGDLDIAAVGLFERNLGFESAGELVWYERPADLTTPGWTEQQIEEGLVHLIYLQAGDIDGDMDDDLVAVTSSETADNVVVWYENRCGEPTGPRWQRYTVASGASFGSAGSVRLADIDDATGLDVLVADWGDDRVIW